MKRYLIVIMIAAACLYVGSMVIFSHTFAQDKRGKAVPTDTLPDALKGVDVKDYFVASTTGPVGKITVLSGHVVVHHKDINKAYFAARGDSVYNNDVFYALKDSRCRIKFKTADLITIGEDTIISIDELVDDRQGRKKKSVFSMLKGKAMFYVVRLFRYKTVDTSVKTQTAVMGVRGTQFGVEVEPGTGKQARAKRIVIADSSENGFQLLAETIAATGGTGAYTKVIVFNGMVIGQTADGKWVEIPAGMTGVFGADGKYQTFGTTAEDVIAFLKAMGITDVDQFLRDLGLDPDNLPETFDDKTMQELLDKLKQDKIIMEHMESGGT